jgi:peptide/nickel transport system ATP-binding protein
VLDNADALVVENLTKTYHIAGFFSQSRTIQAVKEVTFTIRRGETLGLVGESGSGKSTVGRCIIRLLEPNSGTIRVGGLDFGSLSKRHLRNERKRVQMVFQDPFGSLDPRRTVSAAISEGLLANGFSRRAARTRSEELLEMVGLPASSVDRYPHEFSGGQRQRIGIARALSLEPEVLIADEPVSALDVSVQFHILELLRKLQRDLGIAILFVTHDLRVAAQMCDRIAVMSEGRLVELRPTHEILTDPQHEYTRRLLSAIPGAAKRDQAGEFVTSVSPEESLR